MNLMVGLPCMDKVDAMFTKSLVGMAVPEGTLFDFCVGSVVYDARNNIVQDAIQQGIDRILWIDSDMAFDPNLFVRLNRTMDETGADLVTGLYFTRKPPIEPVVYSRLEVQQEGDMMRIYKDAYMNYPKDSVFDIDACGFGGCITTVEICKKIIENYAAPFSPAPGMGEDITFCYKAKQLGAKLVCDSRIKLLHMGSHPFSEADYMVNRHG